MRTIGRVAAAVLAVGALFTVAACSGGSGAAGTTTAPTSASVVVPTQQADGRYALQPDVEYAGAELEYLTTDAGPLGDFAPVGTWYAYPVEGGGYVVTGEVTLDGVSDPPALGGVDPVFYIGSWGTMGRTMSNSPTLPLNEAAAKVFNSDKYWTPTSEQQAAITALDAAG